MKVEYTYAEYKDFPRATAISQSRAKNQFFLFSFAFLGFVLSIIMLPLCETVEEFIGGIIPAIVCFVGMIYMRKVYPKNTEKKVRKAIEEGIAEKQRIAEMIASRPKGVSFMDYTGDTLIVMFKNGLEYRHSDVPKYVYEEFRAAQSAEDYYNTHIKNKYPRL